MSVSKNVNVQARVAANPSTPPKVLLKLFKDLALREVLANPSTPPEVFELFMNNFEPLGAYHVAKNPSTPPKILDALINQGFLDKAHEPNTSTSTAYMSFIKNVALNPSTTPETFEKLYRLCTQDKKDKSFLEVVRNKHVFLALLKNPACPPVLLQEAFNSKNGLFEEALASNPSTPPKALEHLSRYVLTFKTIRNAAANPSTPSSALMFLSQNSSSPDILEALASNLACPPDVLQKLVLNPELHAILASVQKENVLKQLSFKQNLDVLLMVLSNPHCKGVFRNQALTCLNSFKNTPLEDVSKAYTGSFESLKETPDLEILKKFLKFVENTSVPDFLRAPVALVLKTLVDAPEIVKNPGYMDFSQYVLETSDVLLKTPQLNVSKTQIFKTQPRQPLGF